MTPRKTIMIGGSESQRELFRSAIPKSFKVQFFSPDQQLLLGSEAAWIFIAMNDPDTICEQIHGIKNKYPKCPIVVIANELEKDKIIEIFRLGIKDLFADSLKPADLHRILLNGPLIKSNWLKKLFDNLKKMIAFFPKRDSKGKKMLPGIKKSKKLSQQFNDIQAQFFGHFNLEISGKKFSKCKGRKTNALLAFLLHHRQKNIHKEIIMEKFWGDSTPSSARNSLNVAIHNLRKQLEKACPSQDLILFFDDGYQLNPELKVYTDAKDFSDLWKTGKNLESASGLSGAVPTYDQALGLYTGDFLEEMRYEDWFSSERDSLREIYLMLMDKKSNFYLEQSDYNRVITICQQMLYKDQCLEDIHRRLMRSYYILGLKDMAVKQYIKCCDILGQELEIEPSEQTVLLYQNIIKGKPMKRGNVQDKKLPSFLFPS